jgi:hypothetical protein
MSGNKERKGLLKPILQRLSVLLVLFENLEFSSF